MSSEQLGGVLAQRYEVEARIGAGGMGEVYRARDLTLARRVAIKRLAPSLAGEPKHRDRLLNEARSAARVNHQGLAALYDVLEHDGQFLLVMEYVEGQTLRERLREPIDVDDALDVMVECAAALAAAHGAGIVHYDLKPANIMMTPDGRPKILDFGLAQIAAAAIDPEGSTVGFLNTSREVAGTPPYMAPEVLLDKRADARADLFSLGVVFYELLTGQNPFRAPTPTAVADLILHLDPPPVQRLAPSVPGQFQPILDKLLAKSPRQRYATVDDLLVDLRGLRATLTSPSLSRRTGAVREAAATPAWGRWAAAALVALAIVAAAFAAARWPAADSADGAASAGEAGDPAPMFLAVLPITPGGAETGSAAIHAGLATTITSRLTRLTRERPFQMVAAASMRPIETVEDARRQFGVNRVLTFMLIQQDDRVRANLELVDAATSMQMDAGTVEGTADDLLHFQDEVSDRILSMLRLQLLPDERQILRAGTSSQEAYNYFVSGVGLMERATVEELELAADQFRQALRVDPSFAGAHASLGQVYVYLWEYTDRTEWIGRAEIACRDAIDLDDGDARAHACLGSVLVARGDDQAAIPVLEEALDLDPTSETVVRSLARAYEGAGRVEEAERVYREVIEQLPHASVPYGWLARLYLGQGRLDDAATYYLRSLDMAPHSWRDHNALGAVYFFQGRWADAKREWRRSLEINPQYAAARSNMASAAFYEGDFAGAVDAFREVVHLSPDRHVFWGNLGDALYHADPAGTEHRAAYETAEALATEQLELNPSESTTRARRAYYLAMLGGREEALSEIDRAIGEAPEDRDVRYKAAQVFERLDEPERAVSEASAALAAGASRLQLEAEPLLTPLRDRADWPRGDDGN